jgi:ABC-type transport system substrate-binding protein
LVGFCALAVAEEPPLYERNPFDRITLDQDNQSMVLDVEPLPLPNRRVPDPLPRSGKLIIRRLEEPDPPLEANWSAIEKVELFEQMVLAEANRLVAAEQLEEAYDHFEFLRGEDPTLPGLKESIDGCIHQEAKVFSRKGKYDAALAMLRELHERAPEWPGLETELGQATEKLIEEYAAGEKYPVARVMMRNLADWYPQHEVVKRWTAEFKKRAENLLGEARQALDRGELGQAHAKAREVALVWPGLPGVRELFEEIHRQYPRVVVGVTATAGSHEPGQLADFASRRSSRLVYRTLMEFVGPSTEGGKYVSPMGQLKTEDLGRQLSLKLNAGMHWSSGAEVLTGYDLSQQLLAMADPNRGDYRPQWADLLAGVSVPDVYEVHADLHRPTVLPAALLQTIVAPYAGAGSDETARPANGPYAIQERDEERIVYVANRQYFLSAPSRPKEIVEQRFLQGAKAISALKERRIDVIDRVNPWSVAKLQQDDQLVVAPYAVPLVHCLIPNMNRPLTSRPKFRRALVYALRRDAILEQLLGGQPREGCRVVSGPFSPGMKINDPLDYAYDSSIEPRPYDARLAIMLAELALQELVKEKKEAGEAIEAMPKLVLAHPATELARLAATAIERHLKAVKIPVVLEEFAGPTPKRVPDSVDLLYAEVAMWEPVVDARRLLGADGPSGKASPQMDLALRQLEQAPDWPQVGRKLRQIHRIAHTEVAVIPLWQLTDYFACHRSFQGTGSSPVSLYQNVEQWQPAFYYAPEGP